MEFNSCPIKDYLLKNDVCTSILQEKHSSSNQGHDCCAILLMLYLAFECDDPARFTDDFRKVLNRERHRMDE